MRCKCYNRYESNPIYKKNDININPSIIGNSSVACFRYFFTTTSQAALASVGDSKASRWTSGPMAPAGGGGARRGAWGWEAPKDFTKTRQTIQNPKKTIQRQRILDKTFKKTCKIQKILDKNKHTKQE